MAAENTPSSSELEEEIESLKAIFDNGVAHISQDLSSRNIIFTNEILQICMLLEG